MSEFLRSNWSDILAHIAQHVWLVLIATAIAIAIALPLGILITRRKRLRGPLLGIANVMQTIPSLALFGFLIPAPWIGGIGVRTALVVSDRVIANLAEVQELNEEKADAPLADEHVH